MIGVARMEHSVSFARHTERETMSESIQDDEEIRTTVEKLMETHAWLQREVQAIQKEVREVRDRCQHTPGPEGWCTICGRWV